MDPRIQGLRPHRDFFLPYREGIKRALEGKCSFRVLCSLLKGSEAIFIFQERDTVENLCRKVGMVAHFLDQIIGNWQQHEVGNIAVKIQKEKAVIFIQIFSDAHCAWHGDWGNPPRCPGGLTHIGEEEECAGCSWYRPADTYIEKYNCFF